MDNPGAMGPRQMRNCSRCKSRKIKCDRKIPCGPCALRGDGPSCASAATQLEEHVEQPSAFVSLSQFHELSRKVKVLGARVQELEGTLGVSGSRGTGLGLEDSDMEVGEDQRFSGGDRRPWDTEGSRAQGSLATTSHPTPADRRVSRTSPPADVAAGTAASPITARRHMADDEMVFALEDYQMSRRVNTVRNLEDSGDGKGPSVAELSPAEQDSPPVLDSDAARIITEDHPLAFIIPPNTDYLAHAIASLPEQQVCEVLVQRYFDNVEWFQRCLHQPTFMRQCRQFWEENSGGSLALSPDFVCTYLMVVCLGLGFSDAPSDTVDLLALAERLYHVAEGVLWCSRFLHRQTFESLQAISLMTIYGYGMENSADATWALCGSAIKIAQNLGMNRLDAEVPKKVWPKGWTSRFRREMARRVWWNMVYLDWSHAMAHGSTYSIHPSQNLTVLPSNFFDDQLEDPQAVPHPLSVYTPINKHICLFKFAMLYRQITDHMATSKKTSYAFILEMDDAIIELASNLPQHFSDPAELPLDCNPTLLIDSILVHLTANIRLVRLHRSFFLRGYHDKNYERSMNRCVKAAHTILRLLDLAKRRCPVLLNFWIILFYAFTAAVPVCVDLLYAPTEEKDQAVLQILETFRERSAISPAARKSVYVLEQLLQAQNEFRNADSSDQPRPAKRQRGGSSTLPSNMRNDLLKATIRGILQSADLNAPPPTPSIGTGSSGFGFSPLMPSTAVQPAVESSSEGEPPPGMVDPSSLAIIDAAGIGWGGTLDSAWNSFPIDIFQDLWTENGWRPQDQQ